MEIVLLILAFLDLVSLVVVVPALILSGRMSRDEEDHPPYQHIQQ